MCKNTRSGCAWKGRVINTSGIADKTDDSYWVGENKWIHLQTTTTEHSCLGMPFSAICQNQYRSFVKQKYSKGFQKFKDIRRVSNLDKELVEAYSTLIGDADKYTRIISRKKQFLGVVGFGDGFPQEFSQIKIWDSITGIFENQNFIIDAPKTVLTAFLFQSTYHI